MAETPTRQEVVEQLEKLAVSQQFVRSHRLVRFLRFTVNNFLSGQADRLTEHAIGTRVYDRHNDFDPALDGIVRAEAHRLRAKLARYYQTGGSSDPIRIEYPPGSYTPVFRCMPSEFIPESGIVAGLIRGMDWEQSELGPLVSWPRTLKSVLSVHLRSGLPTAILWGPDLILFLNDPLCAFINEEWKKQIGCSCRSVPDGGFAEIVKAADRIRQEGVALSMIDRRLMIARAGFEEERYFNLFLSPLPDQDGSCSGVIALVTERTETVLRERRAGVLLEVCSHIGNATSGPHACRLAAGALQSGPEDVPFASLYLFDRTRQAAYLESTAGMPGGLAVSPKEILLQAGDFSPLSGAAALFAPHVLQIADSLGPLPGGPWSVPPRELVVLPLATPSGTEPCGFLIAGVNPHRELDREYRNFFQNLAARIATAVAYGSLAERQREQSEASSNYLDEWNSILSSSAARMRRPLTEALDILGEMIGNLEVNSGHSAQLKAVRRHARRVVNTVDMLTDLGRIGTGNTNPIYEPVDLGTFTGQLAGTFQVRLGSEKIRMRIDCPPLSVKAWVDRAMWEKIVFNLLLNSLQNTSEGEVGIAVREVGAWIELQIWDTGEGIPATELRNVSGAFGRASRPQECHRAGLEMLLVRRLADLHGGGFHIESEEGRGSRFTVSIPRGHAHLPKDRVVNQPGAWAASSLESFLDQVVTIAEERPRLNDPAVGNGGWTHHERTSRRTRRIVIAIESAEVGNYCERLLGEVYRVGRALSADRIIADLEREHCDVFVAEALPHMWGVIRTVRSNPAMSSIAIVVLSARSPDEERLCALNAGADDFIVTPFSAQDLLIRVEARITSAGYRNQTAMPERHARGFAE